jgi:hypothetical protein
MSEPWKGSCHCGAVRLTVPADAFGVVACHCEDCQRLHGNYFAMLAAEASRVQVEGEEHVRWYDSSPKARRSFCGVCGSRIAKQATGSDRLLVSVGLFGPAAPLQLRKHVFADSKPAWYPLPPLG